MMCESHQSANFTVYTIVLKDGLAITLDEVFLVVYAGYYMHGIQDRVIHNVYYNQISSFPHNDCILRLFYIVLAIAKFVK